jgi:hypothetical protein
MKKRNLITTHKEEESHKEGSRPIGTRFLEQEEEEVK